MRHDTGFAIEQGWLPGARRVPSPNASERPEGIRISLIVVHNISLPPGVFGAPHIEQLFTNCLDCSLHPWFENVRGLRVSAHLLIDRAGQVTQFVPFHRRAWHAGESMFEGRANCNDFSIGIELEGTDDIPYTEEQYHELARASVALMREYPDIGERCIVGHRDIAPGRKSDPGEAFDWGKFRTLLAREAGTAAVDLAGGAR